MIHFSLTKTMKLIELSQAEGRTIRSIKTGIHVKHYEALRLTFTDGAVLVLIGGGFDGYGDYLRVKNEPDFEPYPFK
jgi:hypothetical protein